VGKATIRLLSRAYCRLRLLGLRTMKSLEYPLWGSEKQIDVFEPIQVKW